jgi:hypothetical protein
LYAHGDLVLEWMRRVVAAELYFFAAHNVYMLEAHVQAHLLCGQNMFQYIAQCVILFTYAKRRACRIRYAADVHLCVYARTCLPTTHQIDLRLGFRLQRHHCTGCAHVAKMWI